MPAQPLKPTRTGPEPELRALASNLRRLREAQSLSRRQLAEQIGATLRQVEHWEVAESVPSLGHLRAMARVFHEPLDTLLVDAQRPAPLDEISHQIRTYTTVLARITGAAVILAAAYPGEGKSEIFVRAIGPVVIEQRRLLEAKPSEFSEEEGYVIFDDHHLET